MDTRFYFEISAASTPCQQKCWAKATWWIFKIAYEHTRVIINETSPFYLLFSNCVKHKMWLHFKPIDWMFCCRKSFPFRTRLVAYASMRSFKMIINTKKMNLSEVYRTRYKVISFHETGTNFSTRKQFKFKAFKTYSWRLLHTLMHICVFSFCAN